MKTKSPAAATKATATAAKKKPVGPFTLAIDIGGTGLKAAVLDADGEMITERVRIETPHPCPPGLMVQTLSRAATRRRCRNTSASPWAFPVWCAAGGS